MPCAAVRMWQCNRLVVAICQFFYKSLRFATVVTVSNHSQASLQPAVNLRRSKRQLRQATHGWSMCCAMRVSRHGKPRNHSPPHKIPQNNKKRSKEKQTRLSSFSFQVQSHWRASIHPRSQHVVDVVGWVDMTRTCCSMH
eukprot:5100008-Amphidinium_carterae.1